jgi:hypothetical protein
MMPTARFKAGAGMPALAIGQFSLSRRRLGHRCRRYNQHSAELAKKHTGAAMMPACDPRAARASRLSVPIGDQSGTTGARACNQNPHQGTAAMPRLLNEPQYWRLRAQESRMRADHLVDPEA